MSLPAARPSFALNLHATRQPAPRSERSTAVSILTLAITLGAALGGSRLLPAQTAHYTGPQTVLPAPSANNPSGVAFDQAGNIYLADGDTVYKATRSGGTYTFSTVKSGLCYASGVAVDLNGTVYIADQCYPNVFKETPSAGAYTESLIGINLVTPDGVAVDASGTVYISDYNNSHIFKETPSGGSYTESTIGASYSAPYSVAVDRTGNVYVVDVNGNSFFKETFSGGTYTQSIVASGFPSPTAIAVDANGNVYGLDYNSTFIYKETVSGGIYTQSTFGNGLQYPLGIAVDGNGNVLVVDSNNARFVEVFAVPPSFAPVAVGSTSATQTQTFTFDTGGTGITAAVLTQGTAGLDFDDLGTGTCATNGTAHAYNGGDTCTVNVRFAPRSAGSRSGAVNLVGSGGAVLASAPLQGFGTGPQGVFYPGTQTVQSSSTLDRPQGVAIDGQGNVYIADTYHSRVLKETLSGGVYTESTIGTGLNNPIGLAVDGAGNVYIADTTNYRVLKETLSGGTYTQTTIASGLGAPQGVAVDAFQNVYITDTGNGRVLKETLLQGTYIESTVASGLTTPIGIAVDGDGKVYVADLQANAVYKETPTGGAYTQSSIGSGLSNPAGVAVDGVGNVSIADYGNNRVLLETLSAGTYTQRTIGSGFTQPYALAVDGSGNTYVADFGNNRVVSINVSSPQTLTFPSTNVGSTSATQTLTLANIGNAALTFLVPGTGNNPSLSAGFLRSNTSTCPQLSTISSPGTLAAGATCTNILSFAPTTSGTVTGQLVTTDTHLNASPSTTQVVNLTGVAVALTPIPTLTGFAPSYGPPTGGTSVTITGTSFTGATSVTFSGTPAISFTVVSSTTITAIAPSGTPGTNVRINVTTPGGSCFTILGSGYTYQTAQTLTFPQPTTPVVNGSAPVTLTATASSGLAVTYTVVSGPATISGSTLTYTGAGSVVVRADQAGSTTYLAATAVSRTIVVNAAPTSYTAPSTPVGAVSATQTATLTFAAGATLNTTSATAIKAVTQGAIGLDFASIPGGTCVAGSSYLMGQTCTVRYTFAPHSPGTRYGAINLADSTGALVATAYLQGTGTGPQTAFYPGTQTTTFSTGLTGPFAVAKDGSGNIYIADYTNNRVLKETLSSGSYTESTIGTGLSSPSGVAVDGGGSLYIADTGNNRVLKETLSGGTYVETVIGSGMSQPSGLAVDGSGNLYIGDYGNNRVLMETLAAGAYTQSTIGTGLTHPVGVAVDGNGNVAIADLGNNRVLMETLSAGVYTQTTVGSGTISPSGVAMDGTGTIYIADTGTDRLLKETLSGGVYTETVLGTGLLNPTGVAVDGTGNLLIADLNNHRVLKIDVATPPAFSFPSTALGASTAAQTVTLVNIGNTALTLSALASSSPYFPLDSTTTTCSVSSTLAASATCVLGATFTPLTGGALTGTFNLITDTLNAAATIQQLPLTGTGTQLAATVAVSNASILYGASTTLSATVTFVSGYTPTGAFTFTVGSGAPLAATCVAATGTTETCTAAYPVSALAVSLYTITGSLAADANYLAASGTGTLTIAPSTAILTLTSLTATYDGSAHTAVATTTPTGLTTTFTYNGSTSAPIAAGNYTVVATISDPNYTGTATGPLVIAQAPATITLTGLAATYDGSAHAAAATTLPSSLTTTFTYNGSSTPPTAAGNYTVIATIADPNYAGNATGILVIAPATAPITFAPASHAYGDAPFTIGASSTSDGAFTYSLVAGPAVLTGSTVTLTGAGSITLLATQAATANYSANTQQVTFTVAKALLTAAANRATRLYGTANPTLTGTLTGAVYADTFTATYTTAATTISPVGSYLITPAISGGALANYTLTTNSGTLAITPAPATVAIASSSATAAPAQAVTLTTTVTSTTSGTPTGSIVLYDNGTVLQTLTLTNGTASYAAILSTGATHIITVSYAGDTNFSTSLPATNPSTTVAVGSTDFGFTGTGSSSVTGTAGQPVTFTFQVAPPTGGLFPDVVTFSVTGLPAGATATFTPSSLPQNSGPTAVQMTVQTVKTSANTLPAFLDRSTLPLAFATLLLPLLGLRRRFSKALPLRLLGLLLMLGGMAAVGALAGCGTTSPSTSSAPKSYVLTVTTTSGTVQHSQTVTLNLQ